MICVKSHRILSNLPKKFALSHRFQSTAYGMNDNGNNRIHMNAQTNHQNYWANLERKMQLYCNLIYFTSGGGGGRQS